MLSSTTKDDFSIMFRGAHHLAIKDTYFIDNSTARSGLEILLSKSMPDAFHDSGARDPPPRCHFGTRQGYITKIVGWAHGNCSGNQPLLWMYGPFGVGKTAVAQSCADALESEHRLAASLFFSRSSTDRDDPQRLFTSIDYQIATKCEEYCNAIECRIRRDPAITTKSLSKQFEELFVHPLSQIDITESGLEGRVVVVDGLDECRGTMEQRAIIDIITTSARNGTAPFRWFLTSRPEDHLVRSMSSESVSSISVHLELPVSRAIDHEILIFVTNEFKKIREDRGLSDSWPPEEVLSLLVEHAAGLFIFAATVMRFISDDNSFGPQDQLRIVLEFLEGVSARNDGPGNPLEEMDSFYMLIMQRIPPKLLKTARAILLLHDLHLLSAAVIADYLSLSEEQFWGVWAYLQSVVSLEPPNVCWCKLSRMGFSFHHASFLDFLRDPGRSKELCIYGSFLDELRRNVLSRLHEACSCGSGEGTAKRGSTWDWLLSFYLSAVPSHPFDLQTARSLAELPFSRANFNAGLRADVTGGVNFGNWRDNLPAELRDEILRRDVLRQEPTSNCEDAPELIPARLLEFGPSGKSRSHDGREASWRSSCLTTATMHKAKDAVSKKAKRLSARLTGHPLSPPIADIAGSLPGPTLIDDGTDLSVPEALQQGTEMLKISDKNEKRVVFRLNPDSGHISYRSQKHGIGWSRVLRSQAPIDPYPVPIAAIKEIRTGENTKYDRQRFEKPEEWESRWLTIIYTIDGSYKTLHMIADTRDVLKQWEVSLRKLYAIRQGLITGLGKFDLRETIWERQYWKGADQEGDQKLVFNEVLGLCKRLNVNLSNPQLQKLFRDADTQQRGYLDFQGFQRFVKALKYRPELNALYESTKGSRGKFDYTAFKSFMVETQKSSLSDPDLQSLFLKCACASTLTNDLTLTLDQFSSFLLSPDNAVFSEAGKGIWQDMTRPLSDYYLSSSHNTYLVGHQLVGVSTVEGYIRALLHSCRTVELDIYDGDTEPVIYHGKTFTSKVSLRDICQAINKYAFVTSPYPLIISAEIHCSVSQQEKIVDVMMEEFGEKLVRVGEGQERPKVEMLPSPEELKHKVLVKAKNLFVVAQLAEIKATHELELAAQQEKQDQLHRENTLSSLLSLISSSSSSSDNDDDDDKVDGTGSGGLREELKSKWRKFRHGDSGSRSGSPGTSPPPPTTATSHLNSSPNVNSPTLLPPSAPASPIPTVTLTKSPTPSSHTDKLKAKIKDKAQGGDGDKQKQKPKMSLRLVSLLVYTVGVKCHGIGAQSGVTYAPEHLFSVSENFINRLIKARLESSAGISSGTEGAEGQREGERAVRELMNHTHRNLVRVYPKGMRVNSSNYEPHRYWAVGAQIVAINWQTFEEWEKWVCVEAESVEKGGRGDVESIISAQQLPRERDHSSGQEIITDSVVDPFVEVTLHIPNWTTLPSTQQPLSSSSSSSTRRTASRRTRVIKNNGFNPVWEEMLSIPFDCVGGIERESAGGGGMADLVFVEVAVRQRGEEREDDKDPIAVFCAPLGTVEHGALFPSRF
ncbi:hypothetical protein D9756_011418 [Leucocoprinus leucothites]|uniref:Phosphoinositide phospholipase C n=1 Tax=Leucocoprinus leucothites TaxID=201217 RepID=A0A8H5CRE3_9AGAR|nr:hypothetical protein D9756_011418 [Leucoagaricus leucothites]